MKQNSPIRACITGIGAVSPMAVGWDAISKAVDSGTAAYAPWSSELNPPFEGARLGIVKEFPKERYFTDRQLRLMDKAMSLNTVAAAFALEDSGLLVGDQEIPGHDDIATVLGSAQGEAASLYRFGSPLFQAKPTGGVNPAHFPMIARNVACGQLAIRFGLRGWSTMIASGDAAGAHALARAADLVQSGRTHTVLVGAYEVLSQMSLHQWKMRRARQAEAGNPLDPASADWIPAEGACYFVVESAERAAGRGRKPYAFVERCDHGHSRGASGQGWPALIDRFLSKQAPRAGGERSLHVSCASTSDGSVAHRDAINAFEADLARMCGAGQQLRTRSVFGDARSVNPMYGVAAAARQLSQKTVDEALVSSLTDRSAYALFSLKAA